MSPSPSIIATETSFLWLQTWVSSLLHKLYRLVTFNFRNLFDNKSWYITQGYIKKYQWQCQEIPIKALMYRWHRGHLVEQCDIIPTVVCNKRNRKSLCAVFVVGFELNPETFGTWCKCNGRLGRLTGLVCRQRIWGRCNECVTSEWPASKIHCSTAYSATCPRSYLGPRNRLYTKVKIWLLILLNVDFRTDNDYGIILAKQL